jgi:hypothetical protein
MERGGKVDARTDYVTLGAGRVAANRLSKNGTQVVLPVSLPGNWNFYAEPAETVGNRSLR